MIPKTEKPAQTKRRTTIKPQRNLQVRTNHPRSINESKIDGKPNQKKISNNTNPKQNRKKPLKRNGKQCRIPKIPLPKIPQEILQIIHSQKRGKSSIHNLRRRTIPRAIPRGRRNRRNGLPTNDKAKKERNSKIKQTAKPLPERAEERTNSIPKQPTNRANRDHDNDDLNRVMHAPKPNPDNSQRRPNPSLSLRKKNPQTRPAKQ